MIDFVFSERGGDDDGGVYDNRNGLDYHVPVIGSSLRQPPLDIIHIALEMAPIAKVRIVLLNDSEKSGGGVVDSQRVRAKQADPFINVDELSLLNSFLYDLNDKNELV